MSYDILITREIDELEEQLLLIADPIERLNSWFIFIKEFTMETHVLFDKQYVELTSLTKAYSSTPDSAARESIKKQIVACAREIENFNIQFKRIPRIQSRLEKEILEL